MKKAIIIFLVTLFPFNFVFGRLVGVSESESSLTTEILKTYLENGEYLDKNGPDYLKQKMQLDILLSKTIENEIRKIDEKERIIKNNNLYSEIIFWVVHVILVIGLCASIFEFFQARKIRKIGALNTEVTVKMEELAIKSSSIGVIILIISAVFYFMYLKFVHQIYLI